MSPTTIEATMCAESAAPVAVDPAFAVRQGDCPKTILLVEDNAELLEVTGEILSFSGYQVLTATSESQALEVWQQFSHQIDLLLTDVMMANRATGFELARKLQASKPKLKVVYTSGFEPEICDFDPALGGALFLQKPFSLEALTRVLSDSLRVGAADS